MSNDLSIWIPLLSTLITGIFLVIVAKINRENKPIKAALKKTKIEGNGSLVEAISVMQKEYSESLARHRSAQEEYRKEIEYFVEEVRKLRVELTDKEKRITELENLLKDHEARLNSSHVGEGQ